MFTNIATRLPNINRPDYLEILNCYNLEKDSNEFDILKATKGRNITDNYEFVPSYDSNKIEFDVAATSHFKDIKECKTILKINDKLILEPEIKNEYDSNAIKILYKINDKKYHLGYIPRYYSKELLKELKKGTKYSAMIKSLNLDSNIYDENISASVKLIFNI